jgi:hypothetical protein
VTKEHYQYVSLPPCHGKQRNINVTHTLLFRQMAAQLSLIIDMPCETTGRAALALFEEKWSALYPDATAEFMATYGWEGRVRWYVLRLHLRLHGPK